MARSTFENQSLRSFPVIPFLSVLRKVQPLIFIFRQDMGAGGRSSQNTQNRNHELEKQFFCNGYQPVSYNSKSEVPARYLKGKLMIPISVKLRAGLQCAQVIQRR